MPTRILEKGKDNIKETERERERERETEKEGVTKYKRAGVKRVVHI